MKRRMFLAAAAVAPLAASLPAVPAVPMISIAGGVPTPLYGLHRSFAGPGVCDAFSQAQAESFLAAMAEAIQIPLPRLLGASIER